MFYFIALIVFGYAIWWFCFRPTHFKTMYGRVGFKRIKNFAIYKRNGVIIVIPQLYDGTFTTFTTTKINPERIRNLVGPEKEIPFHEMILRDPDIEMQPALKKFAEKLRLGQRITDDDLLALEDYGYDSSVF